MVLVVGDGHLPTRLGMGEVVGMISAVLAAGAITSIRALRATDNAFTIFFAFTVGGLVVAIPFTLEAWPPLGPVWLLGIGVGVVSFAAQVLMTQAYGALTVPEAAVWQQLTPVASYLWSGALLGEGLSGGGALGVGLGIAGVVYGTVLGHRAPPRPVPADDAARSLHP
jgi:drug/metabolite transporter (DMT)-like permease